MRLAWPLALLALVIVPLAVLAYLVLERRRARYAIHYTNIDVLASVAATSRPWRALVPPVLLLLALTCATAALARPQIQVSVASEQARSRSRWTCRARCRPTTSSRRGSAPRRRRSGVSSTRIPAKYRVGLVTFSSEPYVAAPLTL